MRQFFDDEGSVRIVAESDNGRGAIDMVRTADLDVLILDIAMPGPSGIDVIGMLRAKAPQVGILVFSSHPARQYAVTMIRLGASGYLNKQCQPREILDAVHAIAAGNRYLSREVNSLLAEQVDGLPAQLPHQLLSDREFQVFLKLARGESSGEIGNELSLSPKTISAYRCKLMDKLGLESNSDLTRYAIRHRLLE